LLDSLLQEREMYSYRRLCSPAPLLQFRQTARTLILGLETSCDDTGVAVIDQSGQVLSQRLHSQASVRMGGVIPTFALHSHAATIHHLVTEALHTAEVSPSQLQAVAVSNRPGLKGPLSVGTDYAKYLCLKHQLPIIPIHHMEAHALTARLTSKEEIKFPFLVLLISGGHCLLALARDIDDYKLLGTSIDCSPGECLDKCSRMLGLHNLPGLRDVAGGKAVELVARQAEDTNRLDFPVPMRSYRDCRFSFTGLKATIHDHIAKVKSQTTLDCDEMVPHVGEVCAALQRSVTKHLCERLQRSIEYLHYSDISSVESLVVSGGVASNLAIRAGLEAVASHYNMSAVFPPPSLCTDNGVMVAWNGLERWRRGRGVVHWADCLQVEVRARCPLGEDWHPRVEAASIKCKWIKI